MTSLLRHDNPTGAARRAGDRLLQLAAGLAIGETLELRLHAHGDGKVTMNVASTSQHRELGKLVEWVLESVAVVSERTVRETFTPDRITELVKPPRRLGAALASLVEDQFPEDPPQLLPWPVVDDGMALLQGLSDTTAEVRLHLAPAREMEMDLAALPLAGVAGQKDATTTMAYLGTPVEARLVVGHDGSLSPRVRGALLARGVGLALTELDVDSPDTRKLWAGDAVSLVGSAKPHGWAQCLTVIPVCGPIPQVCGIPTEARTVSPVAVGEDVCIEGLRLGAAVTAEGGTRDVRISADDLLLHTQILGSTGSGKSSLLAGLIREATHAGYGLTLLDPHGQLVDRVLSETPPEEAERVAVVRSGDVAHPTPVNPLAGPNPELASDVLISVLRELHDPRNQGFLGPVFERYLATLMSVQRALLGKRANLALIPALALDQGRLKLVASAIRTSHSELSKELHALVNRTPADFAETTTWISAKFQRVLNSQELRGVLGSGLDHVDVAKSMDDRGVVLIDLAAPKVGDLGAQLLGEMWLIKHWEALTQRKDRTQPHLLVIDEAHLFASGLLPRLLTQARKFGVGVVLAHQNLEQLSDSLREAVASSTNNVITFRTGRREANAIYERLGSWAGGELTRLPRLMAAVSLNNGSAFTDAFTLQVDYNERASSPDLATLDLIEHRSRAKYAITARGNILSFADIEAALPKPPTASSESKAAPSKGNFLDEWLAKRQQD